MKIVVGADRGLVYQHLKIHVTGRHTGLQIQ